MGRYHLFYVGSGAKPVEDIARVREMPGVEIVNDSLPRSVVVDVFGDIAEERLKRLPSWTLRQSHPVSLGTKIFESSMNRAVPALRLLVKK
jgi:hypothetical protein